MISKATEKREFHTKKMLNSKYETLPTIVPPRSSILKLFNKKSLALSFTNDSDERDVKLQGAIKPIHSEGISAAVSYIPTEYAKTHYTGIYASGGTGIIRLSRATNTKPFTPGLALKIFVDDNHSSVNFHAMYSLDGQGDDEHFFSNRFTTKVEKPKGFLLKILAYSFRRSLTEISSRSEYRPANEREIPLIEAGKITSSGLLIEEPQAPIHMYFIPKVNYSPSTDFRKDIMEHIHYPNTIYEITDHHEKVIGELNLLSDFIASSHGDNMAFKHQQVSGICPFAK
jgi:hypothetical protein